MPRKDMAQFADVVDIVHKDDETLRFRIDEDDFDKDGLWAKGDGTPTSFKAAGFRMVSHFDGEPYKPPKAKVAASKADDKK